MTTTTPPRLLGIARVLPPGEVAPVPATKWVKYLNDNPSAIDVRLTLRSGADCRRPARGRHSWRT
jgi:hypothetical protein